jgi:hypothetical protein
MTDKQESSSVNINIADNIKRNIDRDNTTELPFVDAMTTPFPPHSIRASVATLRKLKDQEKGIKEQQRQIQELYFDLSIKEAHVLNLQHEATITRTPSLPPATAVLTETPGPHRLQTKPERPENIAYRAKLGTGKRRESNGSARASNGLTRCTTLSLPISHKGTQRQ